MSFAQVKAIPKRLFSLGRISIRGLKTCSASVASVCEAIGKCTDQRLWKDALQLLDDLSLEGPSVPLALIPKWQQLPLVMQFLRRTWTYCKPIEVHCAGFEPTVFTFGATLGVLEKTSRWKEAVAVLSSALVQDVQVNLTLGLPRICHGPVSRVQRGRMAGQKKGRSHAPLEFKG